MSPAYKTLTVYETADGKKHSSKSAAQEWSEWLADLDAANEMLRDGATLLAVIDRACQSRSWNGMYEGAEQRMVLGQITKDTEFVIRHWQCSDKPGYKVCSLLPDGKLHVFGDAGAWSGPYGARVEIRDLLRYYAATIAKRAA